MEKGCWFAVQHTYSTHAFIYSHVWIRATWYSKLSFIHSAIQNKLAKIMAVARTTHECWQLRMACINNDDDDDDDDDDDNNMWVILAWPRQTSSDQLNCLKLKPALQCQQTWKRLAFWMVFPPDAAFCAWPYWELLRTDQNWNCWNWMPGIGFTILAIFSFFALFNFSFYSHVGVLYSL